MKPENVLVFRALDDDAYGIKLTDFGYSSYGYDTDLVCVPRSLPWQAPEYSDRQMCLGDAMKMDVYSFGLLALWILFSDREIPTSRGECSLQAAFVGQDLHAGEALEQAKQDGTLLNSTLELVKSTRDLSSDMRRLLLAAFDFSLATDPAKRASDMGPLMRLFSTAEPSGNLEHDDIVSVTELPDWHGKLDIRKCFFDLDACDFRIQPAIAEALKATASNSKCESCSSNAAFQLAACYALGLGVPSDALARDTWMNRAKADASDLQRLLEEIKANEPDAGVMRALIELGYQHDFGSIYYIAGILEQAIERHEVMAKAREAVLGRRHGVTRRMYGILADVLSFDRQYARAAEIMEEERRLSGEISGGLRIPDSVTLQKLARLYNSMEQLDKAEAVLNELLELLSTDKEQDAAIRAMASCDLAMVHLKKENGAQAVRTCFSARDEALQRLGRSHYATWRIQGVLADAYAQDGDIGSAVEVREEMLAEHQRVMGKHHHSTMVCMDRLMKLHTRQRDLERAEHYSRMIFESAQQPDLSPEDRMQRLILCSNFMSIMAKEGNAITATSELLRIITELTSLLPASQPHLVGSKLNLGFAYYKREMYREAETLQREVLPTCRQSGDIRETYLLDTLSGLADTCFKLGAWEGSYALSQEEISLRHDSATSADSDLLHALYRVALLSPHMEHSPSMMKLMQEEQRLRKALSETETIDGVEATALLAAMYLRAEQTELGLLHIGHFFDRFLRLQRTRREMLFAVCDLSHLCRQRLRDHEADQLLALAVKLMEALYPDDQDQEGEAAAHAKMESLVRQRRGAGEALIFDPCSIIEHSNELAKRG